MTGKELRDIKMLRAKAFIELCVYDAGDRVNQFSLVRLSDFDVPCMLVNSNGTGHIVALQPVETLKHIPMTGRDSALSVLDYLNLPVVIVHVYLPRNHRANQDMYVEDRFLPLFGQPGSYTKNGFNLKPVSELRHD